MTAYQALYVRQFHEQLMELPESVYEKIEHSVDILLDNPGLLRDYDPPYEATILPVESYNYLLTSKLLSNYPTFCQQR